MISIVNNHATLALWQIYTFMSNMLTPMHHFDGFDEYLKN